MATTHWLVQTPSEFLSKYNATPANIEKQIEGAYASFTKLTIRVFIFYRDDVLLKRQAETWTIPDLQFTTGPDTQSDNDRAPIIDKIIDHLNRNNFPQTVTHELQFMEFSHSSPSTGVFPSTDLNIPSELLIMTVLTTTNAAFGQGIAYWSNTLVPQDINFRWINKENIEAVSLSTTTSIPFLPGDVEQAWNRLVACSTPRLPDRVTDGGWPTLCSSMLQGVLRTRCIVTNTNIPDFGVVAVSRAFEKRYLSLIPLTEQRYNGNPVGNAFRHGENFLVVVGRWKNGAFHDMSKFDQWPSVMDLTGRLREGLGWDWE